jgi:hypothetical protein
VPPSFFVGDAEDAAHRFLDNELGFQCVPFLLTRIIAPLSFLGRSIGVSVASINTTSKERSLAATALRPDKRKALSGIRANIRASSNVLTET